MSAGALHAYIDESYRRLRAAEVGTYLFAAVTLRAEDEGPVRDRMRSLGGRAGFLHWTEERPGPRREVLDVVARLPINGLTVYVSQVPPTRIERARQHSLWQLTAELRDRDVHDLTFEARERQMNKRDTATLANIAKTKVSGRGFKYRFVGKLDEPLLWIADYLAGAAGERVCGGDPSYLARLPDGLVAVIPIPPYR